MNLEFIGNRKIISRERENLNFRLRSFGSKSKEQKGYTSWKLFNNNNVFIRVYNDRFEVRLFTNDNEFYLVKEGGWRDITFECNNEDLIKQFMQ